MKVPQIITNHIFARQAERDQAKTALVLGHITRGEFRVIWNGWRDALYAAQEWKFGRIKHKVGFSTR